jgi:uncharacterized repeat protein (TIGR01451 family)/fimbrial isopeptide formation D2 family protein
MSHRADRPIRRAAPGRALLRLLCALSLALAGVVVSVPSTASAAGTISLDKTSSDTVLLGGTVVYHLAATNPSGSGVEQYNLSYTDVLPVGVTYVANSTSPSSYGEPQVITITDDATATPPVTHQVLVWSNVADVTPGATRTLTFSAKVDANTYPIGSTVKNVGNAYTSSDPFEVPAFDDKGILDGGDNVVGSTDSATTTVTAIKLTKSEGSPESELLRGVNDHQTVYTLTVTNNGIDDTSNLVVTDYLPAGLEFLGCGGGPFNSTTPEYPGASNTVAAVPGCLTPTSVDTVKDPAGYPAGVYTKVTWTIGGIAEGGSRTISYGAGIPQRANTMTWSGTTPSAASGKQAANLENNNGASTRETASELGLTNQATVAGDFEGKQVADSTSHTVTAEDLRMSKKVTPTAFTQGQLATYTLSIAVGEYTDLSGLSITDTIPAGLCPIDADTNWTSLSECAGQAGHGPTGAKITSVTGDSDGSFTVVFTPDETALASNGRLTITYQALMRPSYDLQRVSGPTSADDSFTNRAVISGTSTPRADTGSPDTDPVEVYDESQATISAGSPQLTKLRMANATPMRCSSDPAAYTDSVTGAEDAFTEGDRVCFLLEVKFPSGVDTRNAQLTDFLPANLSYESATELSPGGLIASTTPSTPTSYVTWNLGSGSPRTVAKGTVFRVVVSAIVTKPAPLTGTPKALAKENLAKFRYSNTDGVSGSLRSSITLAVGPPPPIGITKGVRSVNSTPVDTGSTPGNVDGTTVRGNDVVTFRIDLQNLAKSGDVNGDAISQPDVWDVLPAGITCAAISAISNAGICYDAGATDRPVLASGDTTSSIIRWKLASSFTLAPQAYGTLTYAMTVPSAVSVSTRYDNTAAVASYASATNIDDGGTLPVAIHNPASNVSADVKAADMDVPAAADTSFVVVPSARVTKSNVTDITEAGNTVAQAVVGETLTYTVGVSIPAHTSVYNAKLVDPLPTGVTFVAPATALYSAAGTSPAGSPLPPGVSVDPATGTLSFGTAYSNGSDTDQLFEVKIAARINLDSTNVNGTVRTNTATFTSDSAATGGTAITPRTASSSLTVVAPSPALAKAVSPASAVGGDTVSYTLTASNGSGRPPLHDSWVIDCLPNSLSFGAFTTIPAGTSVGTNVAGDGTNGCASGYTRISWNLGSLAGGANVALKYTATVNTVPAGGDSYTNLANLKGGTLNDGKTDPMAADNPLERVLTVPASATVTVGGATITKSAAQSTLTIGQSGTFSIKVVIPKNTAFYDSAVTDIMPTGMSYVTGSSTTTCVNTDLSACSVPNTALTPSGTTIGWLIGDLAPSTQARTVTITYSATMTDILGNVAGTNRTNTARYQWNKSNGTDPGSAAGPWSASTSTATAVVKVVEPGLLIGKVVDDATVEPGQVFRYTLTVSNTALAAANSSPAYNYTVTDTVPSGVVVNPASLVGGTLSNTDANGSGGTISWGPIDGPLAVGGSTTLTYTATLAPSSTLTAASRTNTARVIHYESLPSGGRTNYAAVSATATVTPQFPHVTATKAAASGPAYLGTPKTWTITLTNDGTADARHVSATDTLPVNWTYDTGSATVVVAGGPSTSIEPTLSADGSGRQVLTWADLGTAPATGVKTIVITFTATPKDPDAVSSPGVGSSVAHTNTVSTTAQDGTGQTANASGAYNGVPATASTHIDSADVQIVKGSGGAIAGQNVVYTLAVKNNGPDTAVGPFPVVDTLPPGLGAVSWTGTGWTCSLATTTLTCARTNAADTLASGASFPTITVTVAVPAGTADNTSLTNTATVGSSTYDPRHENNSSSVTDVVDRAADLGVVKHTSGTVVAGTDATYTLDVTNHGPSDSAGPIVVTDTLPSATSFVSAAGTGWSCDNAGHTLTCTRSSGLTNGQAAPQITVVVHVPTGVTGTLTNTASVDGPETDPQPANDSSSVTDPVKTSADLGISKVHQGTFTPGAQGTYELTVSNYGPSDAASPVRITDQLAPELTFVSDNSDEWTCSANASNLLTCTLAGSLAEGASRTFEITVAIDPAHTGDITNSATVSSPTDDPNPGNNTSGDTTGVDVQADLGIVKSHSGNAVAGQNLDFTLAVTNHGKSDSPGPITVTDAIPSGMSYVSASGSGWSCAASGRNLTCTRTAGLAAGTSAPDITLRVLVAPDAGPATLTNRASVSGIAPDPKPENNTDSDAVTVLDRANVKIVKTADPTTVDAGAQVVWTLTVTNEGPSDADNVQVSDTLPPGLSYVGIDADSAVTCADANPVDCQVATMPAGASYRIRVTAKVGSGVADGTRITNTATVSTSTPGDDEADNTDSATITVRTSADLSIAKSHRGSSVVAGGQVTFDLAVHNGGPSDAAADVVVTDTLPAGMSFVSSTGDGWACSAAGQIVSCRLADSAAVLARTDAPALAITVQVASDLDLSELVDGVLKNTANVTSPTDDPNPDNNTSTDTVPVTTSADLSIVKTHAGTVRVGDPLEFTLQVANDGPSTAHEVEVSDTLPAGLAFVSATGDGWTCTPPPAEPVEGQKMTCSLADPLASGASATPITVTVTVLASAYPSVANTATVEAATHDPVPENNSSTDPVVVPPKVDLGITKTHEPEPMQVSDQTTYTIGVSNSGDTDDPGPITVTDALPAGLTFVSGAGEGWSCAASGQDVTCVRDSGLATGASTSVALVVRVDPAAYPGVTNIATVSSPAEDTNQENNTASDPATVLPLYDLVVTKSLDSITGSDANWTIAVTNNGPNEAPSGAVVTDDLPSVLTFVDYTGEGWTCSSSGQLVTCTYDQAIAAGETVGFTLHTSIDSGASGTITNSASVEGGNTDTATGDIPTGNGGLAFTGGLAVGAGVLGLVLIGGGLLLVRARRRT